MKAEATGTIRIMRSEPQEPPCRCCHGLPHVFACGVRLDPDSMQGWLPSHMIEQGGVDTWAQGVVWDHSAEGIEGKKVRVTIEILGE